MTLLPWGLLVLCSEEEKPRGDGRASGRWHTGEDLVLGKSGGHRPADVLQHHPGGERGEGELDRFPEGLEGLVGGLSPVDTLEMPGGSRKAQTQVWVTLAEGWCAENPREQMGSRGLWGEGREHPHSCIKPPGLGHVPRSETVGKTVGFWKPVVNTFSKRALRAGTSQAHWRGCSSGSVCPERSAQQKLHSLLFGFILGSGDDVFLYFEQLYFLFQTHG